jgi:putative DNA primase/helicase
VGNIPRELRALSQWTFWRFEPDPNGAKRKKPPRNPHASGYASPTDPATWGTFDAAIEALERFGGDGVQFLLSESDSYTGIDLDACVNPHTGEMEPWAAQLVASFDSYTELSPSGTGLRIMTQGKKPEGSPSHCGPIEVYDRVRALSITGNLHRKGKVRDGQTQVEWLCLAMKPLAQALAGATGAKVSLLFAGRWEEVTDQKGVGYPSQSEADLAFCRYLALSGATEAQIDAAMRLSGLYRQDKWDNGYGERTLEIAMNGGDRHRGMDGGTVDLLKFEPSDTGNAQAFMLLYRDRFLWCDAFGWLQYTSTHWTTDRADAALEEAIEDLLGLRRRQAALAIRAAEDLLASETLTAADKTEAERDLAYAVAILGASRRNTSRINAIKPRLQQRLTALADEFDQSPDQLNVANGMLDLRTGELEPHSPEQRFTYCGPVPYDPDADASAWTEFLEQVVGGGPEVLDFFQMAVGYSLTGHTREEKFFHIPGPPRSGKGTVTEVLSTLLGDPLARAEAFTTFIERRDPDSKNFDLAALKAARFVVASESKQTERLDSAKLKGLTGGDSIACEFKFKERFNYRPQFKVWLIANFEINGDPDDDAFWTRVVRIPFPVSFVGREDRGLKERLKRPENLAGVLAWAVEGAIRWYQAPNGLPVPDALKQDLQKVRGELDHVQQWLDEDTTQGMAKWTSNATVYQSYQLWCEAHGVRPKQNTGLGVVLKQKGYQTGVRKERGGPRGIRGLKLKGAGFTRSQSV